MLAEFALLPPPAAAEAQDRSTEFVDHLQIQGAMVGTALATPAYDRLTAATAGAKILRRRQLADLAIVSPLGPTAHTLFPVAITHGKAVRTVRLATAGLGRQIVARIELFELLRPFPLDF